MTKRGWPKNKPKSEETKKLMSLAKIGRPLSEAHKAALEIGKKAYRERMKNG